MVIYCWQKIKNTADSLGLVKHGAVYMTVHPKRWSTFSPWWAFGILRTHMQLSKNKCIHNVSLSGVDTLLKIRLVKQWLLLTLDIVTWKPSSFYRINTIIFIFMWLFKTQPYLCRIVMEIFDKRMRMYIYVKPWRLFGRCVIP